MSALRCFSRRELGCARSRGLALLLSGASALVVACGPGDVDPKPSLGAPSGGAGGAAGSGGTDGEDPPPPPVEAVTVTVDAAAERAEIGPLAFGMHASVYDNALHHPDLTAMLDEAGIALLRWPGGGYSDNYHWSTHDMTAWFGGTDRGYLAPRSDFGSFVSVLDRTGRAAMITVNYGSNLDGTGPGEPKEAAAWVAYANGDPENEQEIGVDGSGNDWLTVGFWAALRASEPLDEDDGYNFLRIARPEPLGIVHWEIGNEVFGNGYHGGENGFELDLHVPYDGTPREGHPDLSGSTYGAGVREYVNEMKAVDPTIAIGAVLNTPPQDYSWGPDWNADVLAECGCDIDFAIVHWYPGRNAASLLRSPTRRIGEMGAELRRSFAEHCPANAENLEIAMTELGPNAQVTDAPQATGLFAADAYAGLLAQGFFNIDWLELHNGSFLAEATHAKGPAFHGIRAARALAAPGDTIVTATTDQSADFAPIAAHAARGADGSVRVLLVNTQPGTTTRVAVQISGATLAATAARHDYAPAGAASGVLAEAAPLDAGGAFEIELGAYVATVVVIPAAE